MMSISVLIIDDEANMLDMLAISLHKAGYRVSTAENGRRGLEMLSQSTFDCILCDLKMPIMDGLQVLEELKVRKIDSSIIMMSAFATVDTAVSAMKLGAYDFITKPFKIDEILCVLEKVRERIQLKKENLQLRQKVSELEKGKGFAEIIGESKALAEVVNLAKRVAAYETSVLITGESGTGKELFARGLHLNSGRKAGPFISINCGAIPENLLESEFFGYSKGAFTGADSDRKGLFELAGGGTLFLDEIGELPLGLQVKMILVLEEREIRPLGAGKIKKIDVRLLAATGKNLTAEVTEGRFRQDLLFRINVVELKIPPLRERFGDIPLLVNAILARESKRMSIVIKGISGDALTLLGSYSWLGNVRELKNVLEHAMISAENGWIGSESLPKQLLSGRQEGGLRILADVFSIKEGKVLFEKYLIEKALQKSHGNRSQAAEILEMSYPSLLGKIKEYQIKLSA